MNGTVVRCGLIVLMALSNSAIAESPTDGHSASPLDSLSIMALGALDGRAVIKTADNKMHVLKLGTVIPGTKATVTQILADKLVVEDTIDADGAARTQTVWITKGGADGKVIVQRLDSAPPVPTIVEHTTNVQVVEFPNEKKSTKKKTGDK